MSVRSFLTAPFRIFGSNRPIVTVVELQGPIGADARPGRGLSAYSVESSLKKAFKRKNSKAVVLAINSPGGAPTQARMIMARARGLAIETQLPVISFIEDVGASGGYLIALAGEEIIADPFAIVGSIGVVSAGFGFQDAIDKIGVERRVYTSGTNKVRLDPFRAEKEEDRQKLEGILEETHEIFIDLVKERRGDRITGPEEEVFSGDFFLAQKGKELGLIDEVGDLRQILKSRYGNDVKIKQISAQRAGLLGKLGAAISSGLVDAIAMRLASDDLRSRLGR
ncbi:S49 family peptidase [Parvularcula sp. ZS-1/3]|uniref:S49 family peptidase n=1 Tax=Parvularcula mediterranea TaxID=2732508 RepID=A0A7Y3RJ67_9PROT|nr:S49 family peptidase [Parvularcula mediterranea]NNU15025.1 S49 family peptidase [Parvularcula mediterranea]